MGIETKIQWTDHTFNPWWGCVKVSEGCKHCYADTFANRYGMKVWGPNAERRFFGEKHWHEPEKWNRDAENAGVRRRIFCASMADVFEDRNDLKGPRKRLVDLICRTKNLDWQLLTKRPENIMGMLVDAGLYACTGPNIPCPQPNIWLGTSVEDQKNADKRIPHLLNCSAVVKFLSCEPLLGPVDLSKYVWTHGDGCTGDAIDWAIVGGESGPGARELHLPWVRSIIRQCDESGAACFVKQLGGNAWSANKSDHVDTRTFGSLDVSAEPLRMWLKDKKGGDMAEWPEDLRVRQMPPATP